mmetsp:Transcript_2787/g.4369  ORF Transcript_2787/g.4369 Transcript_2787/m.4369 type:complete len:98 (-) Transcript_2787:2848-3141(-)
MFDEIFGQIKEKVKKRVNNPKHHYQVQELIRNHFYMAMTTLERCDHTIELGAYQALNRTLPRTGELKDFLIKEFLTHSPLFVLNGLKPQQDELAGVC